MLRNDESHHRSTWLSEATPFLSVAMCLSSVLGGLQLGFLELAVLLSRPQKFLTHVLHLRIVQTNKAHSVTTGTLIIDLTQVHFPHMFTNMQRPESQPVERATLDCLPTALKAFVHFSGPAPSE